MPMTVHEYAYFGYGTGVNGEALVRGHGDNAWNRVSLTSRVLNGLRSYRSRISASCITYLIYSVLALCVVLSCAFILRDWLGHLQPTRPISNLPVTPNCSCCVLLLSTVKTCHYSLYRAKTSARVHERPCDLAYNVEHLAGTNLTL